MRHTIPPAALEAGARALARYNCEQWDNDPDRWGTYFTDEARAAFLAMIEAWPGMHQRTGIKQHESGEWREPYPMLCLPLPPQEARAALEERT